MADPEDDALSRRRLLGGALVAGAGALLGRGADAAPAPEKGGAKRAAPIPTRPFGQTGRSVTAFGLGCFYVGGLPSDAAGVDVVRRALDAGCTYFDTAPSYHAGAAERRLGLALEGARDRVVLATKTLERTGSLARRELEASLRRLRTDRVDLIQVHCVRTADDARAVLARGGVLDALRRAQEEGLARHVGVTGHEDPKVMRSVIEAGGFDAVLLPLNPVDPHWASFVEGALPAAVAKGIARIGMKVFASGRLVRPGDGREGLGAEECLRFAYGLDVSTSIVGCSTVEEVDLAARVAAEARPLDEAARAALVARAKKFTGNRGDGVEWYKQPA